VKYLIDTHIFIWWACEPERISDKTASLIKSRDNNLYFSTASSWEVQIKASLGKITFKEGWRTLLNREIEKNGFLILPVTLEHTLALEKLPPLHKDPFDRMLIAQAMAEGMTIITEDSFIRQYPGVKSTG
jgi:PIN domain nuclease of toxin-antitoxin system